MRTRHAPKLLISGKFVFRETPHCLAVFLLISDILIASKRHIVRSITNRIKPQNNPARKKK